MSKGRREARAPNSPVLGRSDERCNTLPSAGRGFYSLGHGRLNNARWLLEPYGARFWPLGGRNTTYRNVGRWRAAGLLHWAARLLSRQGAIPELADGGKPAFWQGIVAFQIVIFAAPITAPTIFS